MTIKAKTTGVGDFLALVPPLGLYGRRRVRHLSAVHQP